jgi:hypothetical protein
VRTTPRSSATPADGLQLHVMRSPSLDWLEGLDTDFGIVLKRERCCFEYAGNR